jgi:hypothetical protein
MQEILIIGFGKALKSRMRKMSKGRYVVINGWSYKKLLIS